MDSTEVERLLLKEGFTGKEVLALRQHAEKEGYPYYWLLSQLKKRFIVSVIIIMILLLGWVFTACNGTQQNLVSYSVTLLIGVVILYIFMPLKPAYKAYKFMKKSGHLLKLH
ncbi:hypothetical protein [Pseudescherichia vulneris]|uniref:hypothetical protein n=1 Tax=Pseudescherichia vulneris TaxID=566 RepID=UPI000E7DE04D|nr:hypothetical protein [Pseudescherichia vulneris]HBC83511.1 hypothetical protein [Escherichia sp.]